MLDLTVGILTGLVDLVVFLALRIVWVFVLVLLLFVLAMFCGTAYESGADWVPPFLGEFIVNAREVSSGR